MYKIIRFYKDGRESEEVKNGLTLEEAREHCQDDSTKGDDFFDGYMEE